MVANLVASAFRRRLAEARALVRLAARWDPTQATDPADVDFWRAVRALPRRQAQTIALFYLEDWATVEISRVLGCTEATVRGHLYKGRQARASRLGDQDEEAE